jgi:signal transduction histidine kinase
LIKISLSISPVRDETGKVTGASVIARDITERLKLEEEILTISAREQRRIGHELHDGLGQQLTGIAFQAKVLEETLIAESHPHGEVVSGIVKMLNNAIGQTRSLARQLDPAEAEFSDFPSALRRLTSETFNIFGLPCAFTCNQLNMPIRPSVGLHLFRIAQEAINNAINHGQARQIDMDLTMDDHHICLTIRDHGNGFTMEPGSQTGMGLRTMQYRATSIGGVLKIDSKTNQGTTIRCLVPNVICFPTKMEDKPGK